MNDKPYHGGEYPDAADFRVRIVNLAIFSTQKIFVLSKNLEYNEKC